MTKNQTLYFCPNVQTHVQTAHGFEACITEHECFSDDPCPLMKQFLEHQKTLEMNQTLRPADKLCKKQSH
jgi:hypothetical protein